MRQLFEFMIILLVVGLCSTPPANAQPRITQQVLSNGGVTMSNESYRLHGTVGQPAIGSMNDSDHAIDSGFWFLNDVTVTSVEEIEQNILPEAFRLDQNYPNPFNPTTIIQFAVPERSQVSLQLFDMLGREVATLVDEEMEPGEYKLQFEAGDLPSGVYLYVLRSDNFSAARKLTLLK